MAQHPKITVGWALYGLEAAIGKLPGGTAERRVRDQFHQLLLALERDHVPMEMQRLKSAFVADEDLSLQN
jgi:hypothetical protein